MRASQPPRQVETRGALRRRVELASQPWLERLARAPVPLVALLVGVLVLVGLLVGSAWSVLALLPAALFLGWLSYLAWPTLTTAQRLLRVAVLLAVLAWTASRLTG